MRSYLRLCAALLPFVTLSTSLVFADTMVLDLSQSQASQNLKAGDTTGDILSVRAATALSGFSFFLTDYTGGNVEFMVWDGTHSKLLASQSVAVAASNVRTWVEATLASQLVLNAGSNYFFGVVSDSLIRLGVNPLNADPSSTMSLVEGSLNDGYSNFGSAVPGTVGSTGISIRVYSSGDSPSASGAPEPSSLLLLGTGMIALAGTLKVRGLTLL